MNSRTVAWLFAAVVVIHLIPIWSVRYLPTADGPEHLYNSVIIHDLLTGRKGAIADTFAIDWRPHPNWLGHAVMVAWLFVVPPVLAEKLLFSMIVIAFLAGAWLLAPSEARTFAFLAAPFTYSIMLQTGFYNFSLSAGLCLIVIGTWWRWRHEPKWWRIGVVAILLVLCYFSHPLPVCIAGAAIGALWVWTLRGRRLSMHARHLAAFVPVAPLVLWFASRQQPDATVERHRSTASLLAELADAHILATFSVRQLWIGAIAAGALAILIIATTILEWKRRRDEDGWVLVGLLLLGLYFWSPETVAGGQLLGARVALFIYVLPVAWLSPRLPGGVRNAAAVLFTVMAVANVGLLIANYRRCAGPIEAVVETTMAAQPESRFFPLMFDRGAGNGLIPLLWHTSAYAAAERRLVKLDNYEARTGLFPTKYRPGADQPDFDPFSFAPASLDIGSAAPFVRYFTTWKLPPDSHVAAELDRLYRVVAARGHARLYERRSAFGIETIGTLEQVLLPMAGTTGEVGGVLARWRIDQSVTNHGRETVQVALSHCTGMPACDFDVRPGETVPIAANDPARPFTYAYVPHGWQRSITFSTVAHRTDRWAPQADVKVPAVPVREFGSKRVTIPGVPFAPGVRLNLRLYTIGRTPPSATARVIAADGSTLGTTTLPVYATNYYPDGDFQNRFRGLSGRLNVVIETDAHVWAFITAADREGRSTVLLPR